MENLKFTHNGIKVVLDDPKRDPDYKERGDHMGISKFEGRRPILWDSKTRTVYVGGPNWFHHEAYQHHNLPQDTGRWLDEGYVGGGKEWADGRLSWLVGTTPDEHPEIADALTEAGIEVPNREHDPVADVPTWAQPGAWDSDDDNIPFGDGDPAWEIDEND